MSDPDPWLSMFTDGARTSRRGARRAHLTNPATEETLGKVPRAEVAGLDRTLAAAPRGCRVWSDTPRETRGRTLPGSAREVRERARSVAEITTGEQDQPVAEARGAVTRVAGIISAAEFLAAAQTACATP